MAVSSYGTATKTSGVVRIVKDLDIDLTGRHVLIVEDILDSGLTLSYLRKSLLARGPASLAVCSLLVKRSGSRGRTSSSPTSASRSSPSSSSATASTSPSATATFPTCASTSPESPSERRRPEPDSDRSMSERAPI